MFCVAAGLAMLIAQGTTQLAADSTVVNSSRTPVTVEANTSGPSELTALTCTTVLVASHVDNSFNELDSPPADDVEQETNV